CPADLGLRRACPSPISFSVRCLPSSPPSCTLAESSILESPALLLMPGPHNNCERQPPMDNRRSISFAIVIANLDPASHAWLQLAVSRSSKRPTMYHGPTPSVSASLAACGESVWITSSSFTRSSCIVSCMPISSTSTRPGRRKRIRQQIPERYGGPHSPHRED